MKKNIIIIKKDPYTAKIKYFMKNRKFKIQLLETNFYSAYSNRIKAELYAGTQLFYLSRPIKYLTSNGIVNLNSLNKQEIKTYLSILSNSNNAKQDIDGEWCFQINYNIEE